VTVAALPTVAGVLVYLVVVALVLRLALRWAREAADGERAR
jgi:hypothetical protein